MNLNLDTSLLANYKSSSQVARILTEQWVLSNMFCPRCGVMHLNHFPNNKPVADFFCPSCGSEYELKSKDGALGHKITDGAYQTMIQRITSHNNPDFFFLSYSKQAWQVVDFVFVPKHFFTPAIIEKRKPLAPTARRAGWIGCNILLDAIPLQGRINIISRGTINDKQHILNNLRQSLPLETKDIQARGWLFDVLNCVNQLPPHFSLADVYQFADLLHSKHPENNNINAKIRQQLQILRDKGFLEFLGQGHYRKIL